MKKFIIVVDGKESTKYTYNLWETFQYEDGTVSEDCRVAESDCLEEFLKDLKSKIGATDEA